MQRFVFILFDAFDRFAEDDGWAISSHIALSALTSLFPFLIFMTAVAGFLGSSELADQAATLLLEAWPQQVAGPIATEIHNVLTQPRGGLVTIGAVLALYFSSSGIEALRIGLNRAYRVRDKRPWWLLRLESIAYVVVGSLALLALALLVVLGPLLWAWILNYAPGLIALNQLVTTLRLVITTFILVVALVIAHKWLPGEPHSLAEIAPGVAFTLIFSLGFGIAFGSYLTEFSRNYVSTYAGLASVMIALVFLYTLASIFVFGGELNASFARAAAAERGKKDEAQP